jgi:hypothetical protein
MSLEIIEQASAKAVAEQPSKHKTTRPEARCAFSDVDCDAYFRVLNRSLTRAQQADTLVGVDTLSIVDTVAVGGENILALLGEYGTHEGPLYNSRLIYGDAKAGSENLRKKDWRRNTSVSDINNLQLLQAMTLVAKRHMRCFDIFMQSARFRNPREDDKYGIKGWEGEGTASNLSQLKVELQGCVDQSRFDRNQSRGKRSHCPLGCFNVRVHDVDLRPRVPNVIRREQQTAFEGEMYWDRLEVWLRFFMTSKTHFENDPDTESMFWRRYRTALYSKSHQDYKDYQTYREDVRGQQRALLRKRENAFIQVTPGNAEARLHAVQNSVLYAYGQFILELKNLATTHTSLVPDFEITWYIVSSITMVYYTMLRLLATYSDNPHSPCHKVRGGGPQPSHAAIQFDMFFNAPLLCALRNYIVVKNNGSVGRSGIESLPIFIGNYRFMNGQPTRLQIDELTRSVVKTADVIKLEAPSGGFVATPLPAGTSLAQLVTEFMRAGN